MYIVIGLGNPEEKYQNTRHNVGFIALDVLALKHDFSAFKLDKKSHSLLAQGFIYEQKITLAKPQTFMNNSGAAVKSLYAKYKIHDTQSLILVHDDIDLPLGKIRISIGSGSAGHKGIESVIQHIGTKDFLRLRIGIQPKKGKPPNVETFVLKTFTRDETELLKQTIERSTSAIETLLLEGSEKAMTQFNQ